MSVQFTGDAEARRCCARDQQLGLVKKEGQWRVHEGRRAPDALAVPSRMTPAVAVTLCAAACTLPSRLGSLPLRLSDREFWELSAALSEPHGAFPQSDNLVSNETQFAVTVQTLRPRDGVYVGVGPEQN